MSIEKLWGKIEDELGFNDHNMRRDRPYSGQPHTDKGERGATLIEGVTYRDLRDCFVRAVALSAYDQNPHLYEEADKGEAGVICENDLYKLDMNKLDIMAVCQNLSCEIERAQGIFPNVESLKDRP